MKRVVWWIIFVVLLGGGGFLLGQTVPRFHRYALTRLDETTTLDLVKDAASGQCWLVYRVREYPMHVSSSAFAVAATTLGPVKCDPIPVSGATPGAPPASAVR